MEKIQHPTFVVHDGVEASTTTTDNPLIALENFGKAIINARKTGDPLPNPQAAINRATNLTGKAPTVIDTNDLHKTP